ncbi:phd finger [Olea europaea subsp. europaea]|uniref:Phd finger n=1 Tax=Olea europaea subsp. europaea TaxID=158383 RepID=A0A8S0U686_OLEEU|nr:phd finger [Olea europaea subsp. europaea]
MESMVGIESGVGLEGVGEKRPLLEDGEVLKEAKRIKGGGDLVVNVKKVAEMVLVLAAMGKMRGGSGTTEAEKDLMKEARERLVKVCEGFSPKDVFPRDAFGGVIEDMGLNKLKEQRLGFRPPKLSIAEKLLISKRKMEKSEKISLPSTPHSSQSQQVNSHAGAESYGTPRSVQMPQSDKPVHMAISSGNFKSSSPLGHGTPSNSTSSTYQLSTSEIRPGVSSTLPSSHLGSTALPRVDRPLARLDGRLNGSLCPSQVQVNYTANSSVRTPTWSVQPQSGSSATICLDTKVPVNLSVKDGGVDGKSGLTPQATPRPVVTQKITGPPRVLPTLQGTNSVQTPSLGNTHAEISKIIQKLLQSQDLKCPPWKPPSRDYMNKALTCQMCMSALVEIDSLLVCDACEKGFHLKCLQTTNQNKVPRGEWHCGKCLSLSNGKPIPPKYGRVMRNINAPKVPLNAAAVTSTSTKKVEASDEKIGQPKVMVNVNTSIQNVTNDITETNYSYQVSGIKAEDAKGVQGNGIISSEAKVDDKFSETCPNDVLKTSNAACVTPVNSSAETSCDGKMIEFISDPPEKSVAVPTLSDNSRTPADAQDSNLMSASDEVSSPYQFLENHMVSRDSTESHGKETSNNNLNQLKDEVLRENRSETTACTGVTEHNISAPDGLRAVYWGGDIMKVVDKKSYYQSCYINGHMYKVQEYVLIRFDNDRLIPSKLQAMWEDNNTRAKWVTVHRCYFPGDLPEAVGRPCGLESSEVCVSNRDSTLMAGLIQSPCEVLPPRKFAEESERRTHLRPQPNRRLPPLYLCKWIYDESKGLFRDISC